MLRRRRCYLCRDGWQRREPRADRRPPGARGLPWRIHEVILTARRLTNPRMRQKWEHQRVRGRRGVGGTALGEVEFGLNDLRRVRDVVRTIARDRTPDRVETAVRAGREVAVNSIVHGA